VSSVAGRFGDKDKEFSTFIILLFSLFILLFFQKLILAPTFQRQSWLSEATFEAEDGSGRNTHGKGF
jgi:hypothetical protein